MKTAQDRQEEGPLPELEESSLLKRFLHHELIGSVFLLGAALLALIWANSRFQEGYHHLWETQIGLALGPVDLIKPLHLWINDGLMALFFFMVGLEIKRELLVGELASVRRALLPAAAALGGMVVPAGIFFAINRGTDGAQGWGIPMATDIAFASGCIALLSKRVPPALTVFLVALAIVDDLGAVAVIAIFYTDQIAIPPLVIGASLIVISFGMGQLGVRRTWPYVVIGIIIWLAFLQSGVHATVAGVLLAFTIPTDARYKSTLFEGRMHKLIERFEDSHGPSSPLAEGSRRARLLVTSRQQGLIRAMAQECHHVEAPLQRIEFNLEPFCVFIIMPLFALANSGVTIELSEFGNMVTKPITLGVFFGLVLGKQLGILGATFLTVKSGISKLPSGVSWVQIWGVSWLGGIGFTMSLFIGELAFPTSGHSESAYLVQCKIGTFLASVLAGLAGLLVLSLSSKKRLDGAETPYGTSEAVSS